MNAIFGSLLILVGSVVFGSVGVEQVLFRDRLFDGTINLVIGLFLTYLGFRKLGDNL